MIATVLSGFYRLMVPSATDMVTAAPHLYGSRARKCVTGVRSWHQRSRATPTATWV